MEKELNESRYLYKVFDTISITFPVIIYTNKILWKTWNKDITFDEEIPNELKFGYIKWFQELNISEEIQIPAYIHLNPVNLKDCVHLTFCDVSQYAYADDIFLRVARVDQVPFFFAAKFRIGP